MTTPREGPRAFRRAPFSAHWRGMGANHSAVDAVVAAIHHGLSQYNRNDLPDPGLAPPPEPPVDRVPVAVLKRNVAPGHAAAKPPKYTIDNRAVRLRLTASTSVRRLNRQQTLQNTPFCLGEIASAQAGSKRKSWKRSCAKHIKPPIFASTNLSTPPGSQYFPRLTA